MSSGKNIMLIVGLACCFVFFPSNYLMPLFCHYESPYAAYITSYFAILVSFIFLSVLAIAFQRKIECCYCTHPRPIAALMGLGTVCYLFVYLLPLLPVNSSFALAAAVMLSVIAAISYLSLLFGWMHSLARIDGRIAFACLVAGFALSSVIMFASSLPGTFAALIFVLLPTISACSWHAIRKDMVRAAVDGAKECSQDKSLQEEFSLFGRVDASAYVGREEKGIDIARAMTKVMPLDLVALLAFFIIAGQFLFGILMQYETSVEVVTRVSSLLFSGIILAQTGLVILKSEKSTQVFEYFWIPALVVFLFGLTIIIPFDLSWVKHFGLGVIAGEMRCFDALLIIVVLFAVRQTGCKVILPFAITFVGSKVVPKLIERFLAPLFANMFAIQEHHDIVLIVLLAEMITITFAFIYLARRITRRTVVLNEEFTLTRDMAAQIVGEECGLTPRELEVFAVLAKGYSIKKISEKLYLSPATIQSYSKQIYRKIGVHSKQALIDVVDERFSEETA